MSIKSVPPILRKKCTSGNKKLSHITLRFINYTIKTSVYINNLQKQVVRLF
jgi:hypothetical protein